MSANPPPDISVTIPTAPPAAPPAAPAPGGGETTPIIVRRKTEIANDIRVANNAERNKDMEHEIASNVVGPMPVADFFDNFLPENAKAPMPPDLAARPNRFGEFDTHTEETTLYDPWIEILSDYCDSRLRQVNTSNSPAPNLEGNDKIKPDVTVYYDDTTNTLGCDPYKAELFIEFKFKKDDDAFADKKPGFIHATEKGLDTLGQITSSATAQQAAQFRTHVFSLLVFQKFVRFLRWDRTGVVVTERVPLSTTNHVAEFMWRLGHADKATRGVDESIQAPNITDDETSRAKTLLFEDANSPKALAQVVISGKRYVFPACPTDPVASPVGRSTRRFMAYSVDSTVPGLVFLKDTWRVLDPNQPAEHEVYSQLHEKGVRHIPKCMGGQDVAASLNHTDQNSHDTKTGVFAKMGWNKGRTDPFRTFRHYRLVLEYIKLKVKQFRNVRELVIAIRDAFIAFDDAFFKAKFLHRDISTGNIMIRDGEKGPEGVLIDWDLCKSTVGPSSKRPERTGTWAFMSAMLVEGRTTAHTRNDDAESFYHVLNYLVCRCLPHDIDIYQLAMLIHDTFIRRATVGGRFHTSRSRSTGLFAAEPARTLKDCNPKVATILVSLAKILAGRYENQVPKDTQEIMAKPYWLSDIITSELDDSQGWDAFCQPVDRETELRQAFQLTTSTVALKRSLTSRSQSSQSSKSKSSRTSTSHIHAAQTLRKEDDGAFVEDDRDDGDGKGHGDTVRMTLPSASTSSQAA